MREKGKKNKLRIRLRRRALKYKEKLESGGSGVGEKMLGRNQGKGVCEGSEWEKQKKIFIRKREYR